MQLHAKTIIVFLAVWFVIAPLQTYAATSTARSLAEKLPVAVENGVGYKRTAFTLWTDTDKDGCNTRQEVLVAESKVKATVGAKCKVTAGKWVSWYDGKTWTNPADVDIDHMVALKEAWDSGARSWTKAKRTAYANDLTLSWSLDAVTDNVNSSKGDRDPSQWLPPLTSTHCAYATHWVAVKYRWRLSVDKAEQKSILSILTGSCGSKKLTVPARAL